MKNAVSRFAVNNARQSSRRHPRRRHPGRRCCAARDVHQAVQVAVGARTWSSTVAMPSSVDASAATGTTDKPCSRQRRDVLVEVLLGPAHRDDGGARLRGHPGHRGADAATAGTGHDDDAAVQPQEIAHETHLSGQHMVLCILQNTIPQRLSARQGAVETSSALLSGLVELDSVRAHDARRTSTPATSAPRPDRRRRLAARAAHRAQPAVRRQRAAHRTRRPRLRRAGDRQPDQRAGSRHRRSSRPSAPKGGDIVAPDDVAFDPDGILYATEVMDGRVSVLDTDGRDPRAARRPAVRERHHRAPGPAVHQRMPRRRPADGTRPRHAARRGSCWRTCRRPTRWRSGPTGCSTTR